MATEKAIASSADAPTASELKTLRELWETGKLKTISDHLLEFVDRHADEIRALVNGNLSPETWLEAVKQLVRRRGSIHLPSDMADQIREINNDIWYHGEKGDLNRVKIKEEWAVLHARKWRQWRIKEILHVIDLRSSEIAATHPRS